MIRRKFCVRGATTGRKNIADQRYCIGRGLAAIRGRDGRTMTAYGDEGSLHYEWVIDPQTNAARAGIPHVRRTGFAVDGWRDDVRRLLESSSLVPSVKVKSLTWPLSDGETKEVTATAQAWLEAESKPPAEPAKWTIDRTAAVEPQLRAQHESHEAGAGHVCGRPAVGAGGQEVHRAGAADRR